MCFCSPARRGSCAWSWGPNPTAFSPSKWVDCPGIETKPAIKTYFSTLRVLGARLSSVSITLNIINYVLHAFAFLQVLNTFTRNARSWVDIARSAAAAAVETTPVNVTAWLSASVAEARTSSPWKITAKNRPKKVRSINVLCVKVWFGPLKRKKGLESKKYFPFLLLSKKDESFLPPASAHINVFHQLFLLLWLGRPLETVNCWWPLDLRGQLRPLIKPLKRHSIIEPIYRISAIEDFLLLFLLFLSFKVKVMVVLEGR